MTESPCVRIQRAIVEDKTVVAGMMQAYLRDLAPFTGAEPDKTGRYEYRYFDVYWSPEGAAEGRIPYLIMADDEVAGFAFVNRFSRLRSAGIWSIAEFSVMGHWRRKGVGKQAVQRLFAMHPGRWEIAILRMNTPALAFWTSVVTEIAGGDVTITVTAPEIWDGSIITLEHG